MSTSSNKSLSFTTSPAGRGAAGAGSDRCSAAAHGQTYRRRARPIAAWSNTTTSCTILCASTSRRGPLAVARNGKLIYARAFGLPMSRRANRCKPNSLFRIASVSKPITAAACFRLIERRRLDLADTVFDLLGLRPHSGSVAIPDSRLMQVTVRQCLQHTGGWDRGKSGDPMGSRSIRAVAQSLNSRPPVKPEQIIHYMMGKALDFDPGKANSYSNFGYCVLGRVIEKISGKSYGEFVQNDVLKPLGIQRMRLGKNLLRDRAPGEVRYYDARKRTAPAISGPNLDQPVPLPYGGEAIETMDANGGWIASAIDLVASRPPWTIRVQQAPEAGQRPTIMARPTDQRVANAMEI